MPYPRPGALAHGRKGTPSAAHLRQTEPEDRPPDLPVHYGPMPNPLATKRGRLLTFFFLYVTEGIPLGFSAVAIAAQMRKGGLTPGQIGTFVASLYLPWAWKWAAGPFVDLFYSERLGHRRGWIVACQLAMTATLLAAMP